MLGDCSPNMASPRGVIGRSAAMLITVDQRGSQ